MNDQTHKKLIGKKTFQIYLTLVEISIFLWILFAYNGEYFLCVKWCFQVSYFVVNYWDSFIGLNQKFQQLQKNKAQLWMLGFCLTCLEAISILSVKNLTKIVIQLYHNLYMNVYILSGCVIFLTKLKKGKWYRKYVYISYTKHHPWNLQFLLLMLHKEGFYIYLN